MKRTIALLVVVVLLVGCGGVSKTTTSDGQPRLVRIPQIGMVGGVCAGLAYYFGMSPTPIRLIWVGAVVLAGSGLVLYLILWVVLPKADHIPHDYAERTGTS